MSPPSRIQENAYQTWLKISRHIPMRRYTTIDGDMRRYTAMDGDDSKPDMHEARFIRAAYDLREQTKSEVILKVHEFEGLSSSDKKKCITLVQDVPILPGLIAYLYTHLIVCQRSSWFTDWSSHLERLEKDLEHWKSKDEIWWILFYKSVRLALLLILHETRPEGGKHQCNSALLDTTIISKQDILNLAAHLALCVTGPGKDKILEARGIIANDVVELCDDLLSADVDLGEWNRQCLLNVLILLSNIEGRFPWNLYLERGTISDIVQQNQGGSCTVHRGMFGSRVVALKELKRSELKSRPHFYKKLCHETLIWRHLQHRNCLPLYGLYLIPGDGPNLRIALVSPWMQQGNLREYLKFDMKANREFLVFDVVNGLDHLHSMRPHIAHRDVKPENILVTRTGRACLADFGLASAFDTGPEFHRTPTRPVFCGTIHYMAPELFTATRFEKEIKLNKRACDMYSLGCTIYAMYTGQDPFHDVPEKDLGRKVVRGERPEFPEGKIPPDMWNFVQNLWSRNPLERHTTAKALSWMKYRVQFAIVDNGGFDFSVPVSNALEEEWEWKMPKGRGLLSLNLVSY